MTELEHATRHVTRQDCWALLWRGWEFYRGQTWLHAFARCDERRYMVTDSEFMPWSPLVTRQLFAQQCLDIIARHRHDGDLTPLYGPVELHAIEDPDVYVVALDAWRAAQ